MRRSLATPILLVAFAASSACADPNVAPPQIVIPGGSGSSAPAPVPAGAGPSLDEVLDALDQRGQNLKSFDAKVKLEEKDEQTQLGSTRTGRVWFQNREGNSPRIRVLFDKNIDEEKNTVRDEKIEYALDNGWLIDRDYQKRLQVRRQVLRPGEKSNLLKLGEGPFPLPIGQKKEEVKRQFDVKKVAPAKGDPAGTTHVLLKPIKGTQFEKKFSSIDVWVDMKTQMPVKIETLDNKERTMRTTELTDVRVNPALTDADLTPPAIDDTKWSSREEAFAQ